MEGNLGISFKGRYHVEVRDSITGEIKQQGDFHNIGLKNIMVDLTRNYFDSHFPHRENYYLSLGTGTNTPVYTDNGLQSILWNSQPSSRVSTKLTDNQFKLELSYSFPATSSYVANGISEAGIFIRYGGNYSTDRYITRTLFTDTEGQLISFNKTSLDILIVNVTLTFSMAESQNANFHMFNNCITLRGLSGNITASGMSSLVYDSRGFFYFDEDKNFDSMVTDVTGYDARFMNQARMGYTYSNRLLYDDGGGTSIVNNDGTGSMTFANKRLANTEVTSETYFRGLYLLEEGCFMLPNEAIFPTYTISDIAIGTGDGVTTQFNNPLSYFKKDTEVIKIDNVTLTRGTDYTINHRGNINKKFEIMQDIVPVTSLSGLLFNDSVWKDCNALVTPMFKPTMASKHYISQFDTSINCYGINADYPAILDYGEEKTFNMIKGYNVRLLRKQKSNNAYSLTTTSATIYIDYSDDGEVWTNVDSVNIATNTISIDFSNEITARYWRIRTDQVAEDTTYYYIIATYPSASNIFTESCGIALGLYDPYIEFTNAPADGSVITMSVGMDIMMKNSNFAIDFSPTINFTVTSE